MALHKCPECRRKISESALTCPNCGFSFSEENLEKYKALLEKRHLHNQEINRKSTKIHLFWLAVFTLVIALAAYLQHH